jgi:hypothetical protein
MGNYTFQPTLASWSSPPLRLPTPAPLGPSWEEKYEQYKLDTDEMILQFRLREARLEGELEHAKREVEEGRKALSHVVTALTSNGLPASTSAHPSAPASSKVDTSYQKDIIDDLEEEIYGLRKENRALKERIRRLEHDDAAEHMARVQEEFAVTALKLSKDKAKEILIKRWQTFAPDANGKGKAKAVYESPKRIISSFGSDPSPNASFNTQYNGIYNQSFDSSSGTLPEFPILPVNHSAGVANIGFQSLDDVLGPEDEDEVKPVPKPMGLVKAEEEEKTIEEQMREQELAMQKFQNVPKPGVLKTGVEKNGKLGKEFKAKILDKEQENLALKEAEKEELVRRGFGTKIWTSVEDRNIAINIWRDTCGRDRSAHFPEFFKYGVQYEPRADDNNYYRTILIQNLPADIELREVLDRVRGGMVLDSMLVNAPNGKTALITFVSSGAADDYIVYTGIHDLYFSSSEGDLKKSYISLIETPSYPISAALTNKLNFHNSTRCLRLPDFPASFSLSRLESTIACKNAFHAAQLTEMYFTPDKTLHLEFSSITAAGSAFAILTLWKTYAGLEVHYEADLCSGPVEELALEPEPRKPLFPAGGFEDGSPATRDAYNEVYPEVELVKEVEGLQRKRLAALSNQKVPEIADMSGRNLISRPWAESDSEDEGEDEVEVKQTTEEVVTAAQVHGINLKMGGKNEGWVEKEGLRKPPVGLEGSKYARLVPGFRDRRREGRGREVEEEIMRGMLSLIEPEGRDMFKEVHARERTVLEERRGEVENPDEINLDLDLDEEDESEPSLPTMANEVEVTA